MNPLKFKQIIYLISATVVLTVAAQVYNNVQNYKINKQRFQIDMQQALDQAIERYYADRAKNDLIVFTDSADISDSVFMNGGFKFIGDISIDSSINITTSVNTGKAWSASFSKTDSLVATRIRSRSGSDMEEMIRINTDSIRSIQVMNHLSLRDSGELQLMAKKLLFSLANRGIELDELKRYLKKELESKKINVDYVLVHSTPHKIFTSDSEVPQYELVYASNSTYLPREQGLEIRYENASLAILKRGAFDLLISTLIILSVVGSLLYLYKVINEQKQLAEIKNDLISNITHEFKTPIATISTAIEGISIFNQSNDPEKTKKYLGISSDQLKKLNNMVEKLLETATLDSDEIELTLESADTVGMTKKLVEKFELVKGEKELSFKTEFNEHFAEMDTFHMENAISNLIDNAIKYGGEHIQVILKTEGERTVWVVIDDGGHIDKQQQAHIFEKFYRIPTGNVHNVKGFGIGLYYTKAMVEKHGGSVELKVKEKETRFEIRI